jgi:dTMP kinase
MGRIVLSDRFALSTEAYQMAGRGLDPVMVRAANQAATHGLRADLTLILDLPPELGQARQIAGGKRQDRLDRESADFHRRVVDYYLAVHGEGVRHLDGRFPPDRLLQAAWSEVRAAAPEIFPAAVG